LIEMKGFPYTQYPPIIYNFAGGGCAGWGTACGTLIAAGAMINLFTQPKECSKIFNELIGWYCDMPFPSKGLDKFAKFPGQVQTVSNSPLCHVSVAKWCTESGKMLTTPERLDRCAKIAAEVAAKTIELLNAHADGTFKPVYALPAETQKCLSCHGVKKSANYQHGKMYCGECHEPHDL